MWKRGLEWQGTLLEAMQLRSKDLSKYTSFKVIACNTIYMLKSTPLSWWYNMRSQQLTTWKDSSYWTEKTIEIDTELPWWPYIPTLISNGHSYVHLLTDPIHLEFFLFSWIFIVLKLLMREQNSLVFGNTKIKIMLWKHIVEWCINTFD